MLVNVPLFSPSGRAYYLTISTENIVKCIPTTSPVLEDDGVRDVCMVCHVRGGRT